MRKKKRRLRLSVIIVPVVLLLCFVCYNRNTLYYIAGKAVFKLTAVETLNTQSGDDNSTDSGNSVSDGSQNTGLNCSAAITVDLDSGKTLYAKDIHKKLYPASLTKLMTALLLSEYKNKDDILTYSSLDKSEPSNKLDFTNGSQITADNAMRGMLIFSANDIAAMVGENISGSVDDFAALMNKKAVALGMNDTHFANANGLQNENHYTSAYDLSLLIKQVYKNNWIMSCLEMTTSDIYSINGENVIVYNTNQTLGKNDCFAGKTGYTTPAGWCLAAFYKKGGRTVVGIVLNAPDESSLYSDMNTLISKSL